MTITVFTSNQARHLHLVRLLAGIADQVFAVIECSTLFPGQVEDFYRRTDVMQLYFSHVGDAERAVFGHPSFMPANVRSFVMKMGDLNGVGLETLEPALAADFVVVFGSTFIKGRLADALVDREAVNIHMGISPQYRGNSCNFWAQSDGYPELVGASILAFSKGLDSGGILFHALPPPGNYSAFEFGMRAVESAQKCLVKVIGDGRLREFKPVSQEASRQIRYSRKADFTDDAALRFLSHPPSPEFIKDRLEARDHGLFVRPMIL